MSMPILPRGRVKSCDGSYGRLVSEELPKEAPPKNGLRLAEFFCCGGGIGLGFRSAGYTLTFANDINPKAAATYGHNLGHAPLVRDIREVGPADFPPEKIDVVTGGFPCVTFSMAGKRLGVTDDIHGKLYLQLCRVITEFNPRYFVAENVEGMLTANGGTAVKLVLAAFLKLGYRTSYELVNMAEHGVPQTRKRVIFVGVRIDQWRGSFVFPRKTHRLAGDKAAKAWLSPARSLREAIGDLPPPDGQYVVASTGGENAYILKAEHSGRKISERAGQRMRSGNEPSPTPTSVHPPHVIAIPHNHDVNENKPSKGYVMSKRVAPAGKPAQTMVSHTTNIQPFVNQHELNETPAYVFNQASVVANTDKPAPTMSTPKQNAPFIKAARNPDFVNKIRASTEPGVTMTSAGQAEAALSDGSLRRMTVRECARVQSFPDWYEFQGGQSDGYEQVGNAVPPFYAKKLALALVEYDNREIVK